MMKTAIQFISFSAILSTVVCGNGYYWRDWNGTVPSDAFVAANDNRGPIYFAQAYIFNTGLFVGQIKNHQHAIALNPSRSTGPIKYSNVLKIFCSDSDSLLWLPTNRTLIPKLTRFVQPVLGGITNSNETVYVGKTVINGQTYVGSIYSDNHLYFTKASGEGYFVDKYELLIHEVDISSNC